MIRNIISLVLLIASAALSFKHGWDTFHYRDNPASAKMLADLGIGQSLIPYMGILAVLVGILLLFPKTFFAANLINAITILVIMALALRAGNNSIALIEIPFLLLPLVMIWLGYPFKK